MRKITLLVFLILTTTIFAENIENSPLSADICIVDSFIKVSFNDVGFKVKKSYYATLYIEISDVKGSTNDVYRYKKFGSDAYKIADEQKSHYVSLNEIKQKMSSYQSGKDLTIKVCVKLYFYNKGGDKLKKRAECSDQVIIPAVIPQMSIEKTTVEIREGEEDFIYVKHNGVFIINPEGHDFKIVTCFSNGTEKLNEKLNGKNVSNSDESGIWGKTQILLSSLWKDLHNDSLVVKMPKTKLQLPTSSEIVAFHSQIIDMATGDSSAFTPFEIEYMEGPYAQLKKIWAVQSGLNTIIHLPNLTIGAALRRNMQIKYHFYNLNKQPLKDKNNKYYSNDGYVVGEQNVEPRHQVSQWKDHTFTIPTEEFHVDRSVPQIIYCCVEVVDETQDKSIFTSDYYPIELEAEKKPVAVANNTSKTSEKKTESSNTSSKKEDSKASSTKTVVIQHQAEPQKVWNPCFDCGGTGLCIYCQGKGKKWYGNSYENCITCHGNMYCTQCFGRKGHWSY